MAEQLPRDSVWDDALTDGLIQVGGGPKGHSTVMLTRLGRATLDEHQIAIRTI